MQAMSQVGEGYAGYESYKAQGDYQQGMLELNAKGEEFAAEDAMRRGSIESGRQKARTKQIRGKQKASLAAQGIDINSGSAADVQDETELYGEIDRMTIQNNAYKEAWGHRANAEAYRSKGRMAQIMAQGQARQSLVTGITNSVTSGMMASNFYKGKTSGEEISEAIKSTGKRRNAEELEQSKKYTFIS